MHEAHDLTRAERDANYETLRHIAIVRLILDEMSRLISFRGLLHDQSKLERPEVAVFAEFTPKLKGMTYGSDEYRKCLAEMRPALDHHYAANPHHPEHYPNGVSGMTIIDLVEMLADWKADTLRHEDGDMVKSIGINGTRFDLSPQLKSIFLNSVPLLDEATTRKGE